MREIKCNVIKTYIIRKKWDVFDFATLVDFFLLFYEVCLIEYENSMF
jgi:hypothetical protein